MLTIKQSQLLNYLIKKIEESGASPSYEEICIHLNLKSKSGIHRIVHELFCEYLILILNLSECKFLHMTEMHHSPQSF